MGGTRCFFRDCKVSQARYPDMHFFHFSKVSESIDDWARYTGIKDFATMPENQRRNKVICGRHFKDTYFMNYKQDRISKLAVPTITRLSSQWALDYEENPDEPKLIELTPPTASHLIRPLEFPDPQCFNSEDIKYLNEVLSQHGKISNQENIPPETEQMPEAKRQKINDDNATLAYILENEDATVEDFLKSLTNEDNNNMDITDDVTIVNTTTQNANDDEPKEIIDLEKSIEIKDDDNLIKELKSHLENKTKELQETKLELAKAEALNDQHKEEIKRLNMQLKKSTEILMGFNKKLDGEMRKNKQLELEKSLDQESNKDIKILLAHKNKDLAEAKAELFKSEINFSKLSEDFKNAKFKLDDEIKKNKEMSLNHEKLLKAHNDLKQAYTSLEVRLSQQGVNPADITMEDRKPDISKLQAQYLSKLQLFNGIKRYLSQRMMALLRMQLLSGSTERDWKPDERRVAMDLLGLGENVYKYFTDEWLVRLPRIRTVEDWLNQHEDDEDEEIL